MTPHPMPMNPEKSREIMRMCPELVHLQPEWDELVGRIACEPELWAHALTHEDILRELRVCVHGTPVTDGHTVESAFADYDWLIAWEAAPRSEMPEAVAYALLSWMLPHLLVPRRCAVGWAETFRAAVLDRRSDDRSGVCKFLAQICASAPGGFAGGYLR